MRAFCFAAVVLALPAVVALAEPWTFVSTPDFLNVDVGDLTTYSGPAFNAPSGNSYNASWGQAMDYFLDGIKAENPDFVTVAGDMVMARWWQDATYDGVFGPKFDSLADRNANSTLAIEQNRIRNATDFYYTAWKERFASRNLPVYTAVGDHELGDDPSWNDAFGKQTVSTYRDQFSEHFVQPFTTNPAATLAAGSSLYSQPTAGQHAESAYAIKHKNMLLVTIDVFKQNGNLSVTPTVADEQLAWLKQTLADAAGDPTIDHVFVQGHTPVLTPVASRVSSRLTLQDGADSAFWQTLRNADIDVYLTGEVHDVTVTQDKTNDLLQIAHGGIFGFPAANSISYLKGTVDGDLITLEMKELGFTVSGGQFYQPGNPVTQLRDTITLDTNAGFQTTGRVTIDKSSGATRYLNATGVFAGLVAVEPGVLGSYGFQTAGTASAFTIDTAAASVVGHVRFSAFEATGVPAFHRRCVWTMWP